MKEIQKALAAAGFSPGPIDGAIGPRTLAAIRAFQTHKGLRADGIVGPLTRAALGIDGVAAFPSDLSWMIEAARLRGTKETPGAGDNPTIMGWASGLGLDYDGDDVPWCGLFVAHCIGSALPDEPRPGNVLSARAWGAFGAPAKPQVGAVMVFWRGEPNGWQGHVGFYWAEDDTAYHILGGNQGNAVSVARIPRNRLLGARWPLSVPQTRITRLASAGGMISTNEA